MAEDSVVARSPQLIALLERPPLCVGEDHKQYKQLCDLILDEINPITVSEYMLAYDIAAAEWELLRLQGLKTGMINSHVVEILKKPYVTDRVEVPKLLEWFRDSLNGDDAARNKLNELLEVYDLSTNEVVATAFEQNVVTQLQTDHMVNSAFRRREAAYTQLERRRANRGSQVGSAEQKQIETPVIEGEATPIVPSEPTPTP